MRKLILAGAGLIAAIVFGSPGLAYGAETVPVKPLASSCVNLGGWYVNPDEQDTMPESTVDGLKFVGKDLVHHSTSGIDLADMDKVAYSFHASGTPGKLFFKVETNAPYSTIITTGDGKLWSTAMAYDQDGGQGHPLAKYSDFVGKPVKPGKTVMDGATKVVTFGVGYATEDGSTVVDWIKFHGTTYNLRCAPRSSSPSPSGSTSGPSATQSHSNGAGVPTNTTTTATGSTLPVTGPSMGTIVTLVVLGLGMAGVGGLFLLLGRQRRRAEHRI